MASVTASTPDPLPSERRLTLIPWHALAGLGLALTDPLAEVLAGSAAERVVDRFLRAHREFDRDGRAAAKEAIYGVAVWRRRLEYQVGATSTSPSSPPLLLLASLLRDLAGLHDAEALLGLPPGALPPARPPPPDLAARLSFPDWLAAVLEREVGDEALALADALNQPGPVCLRPNA